MKIKLPTFKRDPDKERALARARQSAAFYDIAAAKGGMSVRGRTKDAFKRRMGIKGKEHGPTPPRSTPRQKKPKYIPGTLGASVVSDAVKQKYGAILSRQERKRLISQGVPFQPYYNGEVYKR